MQTNEMSTVDVLRLRALILSGVFRRRQKFGHKKLLSSARHQMVRIVKIKRSLSGQIRQNENTGGIPGESAFELRNWLAIEVNSEYSSLTANLVCKEVPNQS